MEHHPFIKVGNGTTKFYSNLCRSYLKNYESINVIAGGYKISVALEIYRELSTEFIVGHLQHFCIRYDRMHTMTLFSITHGEPILLKDYNADMNQSLVVDDTTPVSDISKLVLSKDHNSMFAIGETSVRLFFAASQLWLQGIYVYQISLYNFEDTYCLKMKLYKHEHSNTECHTTGNIMTNGETH